MKRNTWYIYECSPFPKGTPQPRCKRSFKVAKYGYSVKWQNLKSYWRVEEYAIVLISTFSRQENCRNYTRIVALSDITEEMPLFLFIVPVLLLLIITVIFILTNQYCMHSPHKRIKSTSLVPNFFLIHSFCQREISSLKKYPLSK